MGFVEGLTARDGIVIVIVLFIAYKIYGRVAEERKIQALGGHAPKVASKLPFGIDFIMRSVQYAGKDENLAMWHLLFMKHGNPANPYTAEAGIFGRRIVFTADYENIKAILATQFNDYGKGEKFNEEWKPFLGDSIFSTDHSKWHDSRQLIRPQFIKDRVSDLDTFETHSNALIEQLGPAGKVVDVKELFFRYTLDAATEFLMGRSVDSLHGAHSEFAEAFQEIQRLQNMIARLGPAQMFMSRKDYNRHIKTLNEFVEPYIEEALAIPPEELEKKANGYTFLHAIATYTRDRQVLRDQLVAVLLAGRDTTACTLSWTFYELANHPDILAKLRKEVENVVGLSRPPTYADLKNMRFLQHVMNETLRLYPVVPFNVRLALKDTTLPHGGGPDGLSPIGILKDTPVAYSTHYMQLIERNYPPVSEKFSDPALFDPDRWDNWQPKHWTYIPFNGGPRLCVGQQFALTEMGYTICKIVQKYSKIEPRGLEKRGPIGGFESARATPGGEIEKGSAGHVKSLVERVTENRIRMKSEIVLSPSNEVRLVFRE